MYIRKTYNEMINDSYARAGNENLYTEEIDEYTLLVTNYDHNTKYYVYIEDSAITGCACPHFYSRKVICKHMVAASYFTGFSINY